MPDWTFIDYTMRAANRAMQLAAYEDAASLHAKALRKIGDQKGEDCRCLLQETVLLYRWSLYSPAD